MKNRVYQIKVYREYFFNIAFKQIDNNSIMHHIHCKGTAKTGKNLCANFLEHVYQLLIKTQVLSKATYYTLLR